MADKPKFPFAELGASGLRRTGGYVSADFLPELHGLSGTKKYAEMSQNDPVVGALLFAITMLLRGVPWRVEAPKGAKGKQADQLVAWVTDELFTKLEGGWANLMADASTCMVFGFAPCEVVYVRRDDGRVGVKRIALRSQETLERWEFNDQTGELLGLWQQDWIRPRVFIPTQKLVNFRTSTQLQNPEGRSVLRTSYVAWMRKRAIEEAEGRAALRAAGVVKLSVPGALLEPGLDDVQTGVANAYKTMATNLAQDRQGAVVLPSDVHPETKLPLYNLEFVVADGRRPGDMTPIIERYDKRIASTVLADFILLGQQSVGSFALSSDKTMLFSAALGAWTGLFAQTLNSELMPGWWALNGFPPELMPKLVPGDVETQDLAELGGFITALVGAGMPLFPDPVLQAHLRQQAGLPEADEEALIQAAEDKALEQQLMAGGGMLPPEEDEAPVPVQKTVRSRWHHLQTYLRSLT